MKCRSQRRAGGEPKDESQSWSTAGRPAEGWNKPGRDATDMHTGVCAAG